jgi:MYXO-CTERM domain-containing protein
VIGGKAATQDQINSTVAILAPDDPTHICSGILIAPSVVVTAAHCMFKDKDEFCTMEYSNYDLTVVAGALDANTASEDQHYEIARMHYRKDFFCHMPSTIGKANDLAILLLKRPVNSLSPVPVFPIDKIKSNLSKGALVTIEGYGHHNSTAMQIGQLYTAETPYQESNDTELAAGAVSAPDTCTGDSGGPAYLAVDGVRHVVGMTSRQNGVTEGDCSMGSMGGIYTILGNDDYNIWLKTNSDGAYTGSSFISGGADGGVDGGSSGIPGCNCKVGSAPASSRTGLWLGVGLALLVARRRRS